IRIGAAAALGMAATMTTFGCDGSSAPLPTIIGPGDITHRDGGPSGSGEDSGPGGGHSMVDGSLILGHGLTEKDGGGRDASCGATTLSATPPAVNVLLVIDESG